jgi:Fur family transcriptional regulator, peroxide stress response regulator
VNIHHNILKGLQASGVKVTVQRKAICEWLDANDTHPSASAVFDALGATTPGLSLATVYNTLALLLELDLIHEVTHQPDGSVRYDSNTIPHLNLVCTACGNIVDQPIPDDQSNILDDLVRAHSFLARDGVIVIHGMCIDCQSRERPQ